jgi:hypothetical protein
MLVELPQTFKNDSIVIGSSAGPSAVAGLTVYGDISARGTIYGLAEGITPPQNPTDGQILTYDGSTGTWVASAPSTLVKGTAVTLTNQSSVEYNIPSTTKRITVMLAGVSVAGAYSAIVQVGTASSWITSDYLGASVGISNNSYIVDDLTIGFRFSANESGSATIYHGMGTLCNLTSNQWVWSGTSGLSNFARPGFSVGSINANDTITRIRLTTSSAGTFDAGTVNVMWE